LEFDRFLKYYENAADLKHAWTGLQEEKNRDGRFQMRGGKG
jgi:hypothetical protein